MSRGIFVLRDVDGLSNQEVGEILNLSTPAVKSRLHRSRMMLRKKLHRFYEEFVGTRESVRVEAELLANVCDLVVWTSFNELAIRSTATFKFG